MLLKNCYYMIFFNINKHAYNSLDCIRLYVFLFLIFWVLPKHWKFGILFVWKISNAGRGYIVKHRCFANYDKNNQKIRLWWCQSFIFKYGYILFLLDWLGDTASFLPLWICLNGNWIPTASSYVETRYWIKVQKSI